MKRISTYLIQAAVVIASLFVARLPQVRSFLNAATLSPAEKTREKVRKISEGSAYQPPTLL